jgi:hypothetical protein
MEAIPTAEPKQAQGWSVFGEVKGDPVRGRVLAGRLAAAYRTLERRLQVVLQSNDVERQELRARMQLVDENDQLESERAGRKLARLRSHLRTYMMDFAAPGDPTMTLSNAKLERRKQGDVVQTDRELVLRFLAGQGLDVVEEFVDPRPKPKLVKFRDACKLQPDGTWIFEPTGALVILYDTLPGSQILQNRNPIWTESRPDTFKVKAVQRRGLADEELSAELARDLGLDEDSEEDVFANNDDTDDGEPEEADDDDGDS